MAGPEDFETKTWAPSISEARAVLRQYYRNRMKPTVASQGLLGAVTGRHISGARLPQVSDSTVDTLVNQMADDDAMNLATKVLFEDDRRQDYVGLLSSASQSAVQRLEAQKAADKEARRAASIMGMPSQSVGLTSTPGDTFPPTSGIAPDRTSIDPGKGFTGGYDKAPWFPLLAQTAKELGVPLALVLAVVDYESGGNPEAQSPENFNKATGESWGSAQGLFQIMPFHFAPGTPVSVMRDPRVNIRMGVSMLADAYKRYGKWDSAIAAHYGAIDANGNPTSASDGSGTPGTEYVRQVQMRMNKFASIPATTMASPTGQTPTPTGQPVTPLTPQQILAKMNEVAQKGPLSDANGLPTALGQEYGQWQTLLQDTLSATGKGGMSPEEQEAWTRNKSAYDAATQGPQAPPESPYTEIRNAPPPEVAAAQAAARTGATGTSEFTNLTLPQLYQEYARYKQQPDTIYNPYTKQMETTGAARKAAVIASLIEAKEKNTITPYQQAGIEAERARIADAQRNTQIRTGELSMSMATQQAQLENERRRIAAQMAPYAVPPGMKYLPGFEPGGNSIATLAKYGMNYNPIEIPTYQLPPGANLDDLNAKYAGITKSLGIP